jgi:hypothetical protein
MVAPALGADMPTRLIFTPAPARAELVVTQDSAAAGLVIAHRVHIR